ncbi:MAG: hypothetical protein M3340_01100 [Actinomycetota bacterium]|nr:hypothetical protein [Actinomycetota bacterium]
MPGLAPRAVPAVGAALALATMVALAALLPQPSAGQDRNTSTTLLSRALDGGTPNGASTNAVISGDLRFARLIAFESEASDLVSGDTNELKDVFAIRRAGSFGNTGSEWKPGGVQLVSRGVGGAPADGPSFDPAVDGNLPHKATCVAFLSDATNLVSGDTNGTTDAFLAKAPKFAPRRVSLPGDRQSSADTTAVAVSGDCSRTAFVTGGKLYVRAGSSTRQLATRSNPADPSFAAFESNHLVFGAKGGVYLSKNASGRPTRLAKGSNPAYDHARRRKVVAYERIAGGHRQVAFRNVGGGEQFASGYRGSLGNGDSRDPVVVNTGFFVGFESDASNLPTKTSGVKEDRNGLPDAYLFTGTRKVTALESVDSSNDPLAAGGRRPSTSYYRNYVVFDSSAGDPSRPPQVYLRYLGGI